MRRPLLIPAAILLLAGCGAQPPQAAGGMKGPPPPNVGAAKPLTRELPVVRELTGRIEAVETVDVRPRVGGPIERVLVADGAEVKVGDVLMEIDPAPLRIIVARAEAEVARSEALQAQAKLAFERSRQLLTSKAVSQQLYDDQEAALRVATAQVAAARTALDSARLDLGYARVTAPIAGRIGRVLATTGNLVQGGGPVPATLLATIVSREVYVTFDLDEGTWQKIGARLRAVGGNGAPAMPVAVGLAGDTDFPHAGAVAFADNRIDEGSGSIRVRARLAGSDLNLTPGAFAHVRIELSAPRPVLLVHERAVLSQLNTRYVLTVDDQGATGFRPVQLGDTVGNLRVVESGLKPDERIVVVGLAKVFFPGMPVNPSPASMETLELEGAPGAPAPAADKPVAAAEPAGEAKPADAKPAAADATAKPAEGAKP
jgi:gold/copper resistance efflux system membrane fusion protein